MEPRATPCKLCIEGAAEFQQGINLILSRWSALQISIENAFAGPNSRHLPRQLADDIFSFFTLSKEPLYIDDLEDRLDEFMLTLNTEIDDGSIEEVAEKLMIMHEECLDGNYQSVQSLKNNPPSGVVHIRQEGNDDDDDDDDDEEEDDDEEDEDETSEMAVDASKTHSQRKNCNEEMMVNEPISDVPVETDGWTVVASRRNKGRKN